MFRVPRNCRFEIDDIEKEWTWSLRFCYIRLSFLAGAINVEGAIVQAFRHLELGGRFEAIDIDYIPRCENGTLEGTKLYKFMHLLLEASKKSERPLNCALQYEGWMEKANFDDVQRTHHRRWIQTRWDFEWLQGLCLRYFTRYLGWNSDKVMALCAEVSAELKSQSVAVYFDL